MNCDAKIGFDGGVNADSIEVVLASVLGLAAGAALAELPCCKLSWNN